MVDHNKIRAQLIDGAIKAVSEFGLEGLTTRNIEAACGVTDSYIYRYYENKEDLLRKAFIREDNTLISVIDHYFPVMQEEKLIYRDRCYALWKPCWDYLVARPDVCKFYVRFYYSTYFKQFVSEEHLKMCEVVIDKMKTAFPKQTNIEMILHHILETLLGYGMKVATGEVDNTPENADIVFNILFNIVSAYTDPKSHPESKKIEEEGKMSYLEFYSIVQKWK